MLISQIVAMASNRVIGNKGEIPWKIPGEQKMFKEITMGHALGRLEIVALRRQNASETGPGAHDVDDHHRQLRAGKVRDTLGHQRHSRGRRRGHHPLTTPCGAVEHIRGSNFRFGLDKGPANLRQPHGHVLGYFVLRCDGIAEKEPTAGLDCGLAQLDVLVAASDVDHISGGHTGRFDPHHCASALLHRDTHVPLRGNGRAPAALPRVPLSYQTYFSASIRRIPGNTQLVEIRRRMR